MKYLIVGLLAGAALAAPRKQTFTGVVTDDMCAQAGHAAMRMGPTDAECTVACAMVHNASYVLSDGKKSYVLSDQRTAEKFAGQKVKVVGTLDAPETKTRTISVNSMTAAK